jgi:hypothetical protein
MRRFAAAFIAASVTLSLSPPEVLFAQTPAFVRVSVTDSTHQPVVGADLAVLALRGTLYMVGRSDAAGHGAFRVDSTRLHYEIVARKLGYAPDHRNLTLRAGDTTVVDIVLARSANPLDTVRVIESQLDRDKRPYLGADEIAANKDLTMSLADVLVSIRSDIQYQSFRCQQMPVDVGIRLRGPIPPPGGYRQRLDTTLFSNMQVFIDGEAVSRTLDPGHLIRTEHIAEVRYVNCYDQPPPGMPVLPWPALYVKLKPGVDWDLRHGSFEKR